MDPQHFLLSDVATFLSKNGTPTTLYLSVRKLEAGLHLRVGWLGVSALYQVSSELRRLTVGPKLATTGRRRRRDPHPR